MEDLKSQKAQPLGRQFQCFTVSYTHSCRLTPRRAPRQFLKRNENIRPSKGLYKNVLHSFVYNSPKPYRIQVIHFGTIHGAFSDFADCACTHSCVCGTRSFATHVSSGDRHSNDANSLALPHRSHPSFPHTCPANLFFVSFVISEMLYKWDRAKCVPLRWFFSFSIISWRFTQVAVRIDTSVLFTAEQCSTYACTTVC